MQSVAKHVAIIGWIVEYKKPNKYHTGRPQLNVPQRGDTRRPAQQAADGTTAGHNAPSKTTFIARVRQVVFTKKTMIIGGALIVAGGVAVFYYGPANQPLATSPTYPTILPSDTPSVDELGGWKRISPPENDPVFAYADQINNVPISVSQQPLPDSFQGNTDAQVAELAKKFNATTEIDADGTTVYVGTSAKGPQSVILTKNDLLILIKSEEKIDNKAWAAYVQSLDS